VTASLDYQPNLSVVDRFPFSLYHHPIRNHVLRELETEQRRGPLRILNVGCGLSQILPHIDGRHSYTGVDVDERSLEVCRQRFGGTSARFASCEAYSLPFPDESFDFLFATEVVEHVLEPQRWLAELVRVLARGGKVQLSTPNYGGITLPLIESTFLELVARRQGFTRKGMHPTPFTARSLQALLERGGLLEVKVSVTPGWLALVASGRKP
jgi:ubiquinone/menaquinone biosynthesis C-methylase UbiE